MTEEQNRIVQYISENDRLAVSACAGSGKTTTLINIAKTLKPQYGLYLAYNKAMQLEAASKFPSSVRCDTIHALAYKHTIKGTRKQIQDLTWRSIRSNMSYKRKVDIVDAVNKFCMSDSIDIQEFTEDEDVIKIWNQMLNGTIKLSHNGYLKLFHINLANKKYRFQQKDDLILDILLLDECQDSNAVTLEVFKLLPARKKIMVGEIHQQIFGFNGTVNGFELLDYPQLSLTKSFRCSKEIANKVQAFMRKHLDPNYVFEGTDHSNSPTKKAYLSRTNNALLTKMSDLVAKKVSFTTTRNINEYFALPLSILTAERGGSVYYPQYKWLESEAKKSNDLREKLSEYVHDINLKSALYALESIRDIWGLFNKAKTVIDPKSSIILSTAHSSKGLTLDSTEILSSWEMPDKDECENYDEELRLIYVGATRAKQELLNADHLLN
jgi:F-box protein 18 (helicase)